MKALILQPKGIGDIIFCQTIAQDLIKKGYEVHWTVIDMFYDQVRQAYPDVFWVREKNTPVNLNTRTFQEVDGYEVLPIKFSDTIAGVPYKHVMRAKYDMLGMDWRSWVNHAMPRRNYEKERDLINLLNAEGEFCLVNRNWTGRMRRVSFTPKTTTRVIEMREIKSYSLFDWMGVMEAAKEIETVSTSILYLLFLIELKCRPVVYKRGNGEPHEYYDYIFGDYFEYVHHFV